MWQLQRIKNMKFNEEKLIETARPLILKGRPGDWNHALRVVKWVKKLGKSRNDIPILITSAYIHDIGWSGMWNSEKKVDLEVMLKLEHNANRNTPVFISEILNTLHYSRTEIEVVTRLVKAADNHESKSGDEAIIVDADNLSKLSVEHVMEKYKTESYKDIVDKWENEFPNRIKTEEGKRTYLLLLEDLKIKLKLSN